MPSYKNGYIISQYKKKIATSMRNFFHQNNVLKIMKPSFTILISASINIQIHINHISKTKKKPKNYDNLKNIFNNFQLFSICGGIASSCECNISHQ